MLNLTGGQDFDPLKVTDLIASEFLSFQNVALVPVNLALAELQRQGKHAVETPADAVALARALGAEATIVVALHEYNPYDPPVIGLTMQWYDAQPAEYAAPAARAPEPAAGICAASDAKASQSPATLSGLATTAAPPPRWQVQRVFNAADEDVREQIRAFARERDGDGSPYGWRKYTRSQELYVRYCGWATIRTMLRLDRTERAALTAPEAKP